MRVNPLLARLIATAVVSLASPAVSTAAAQMDTNTAVPVVAQDSTIATGATTAAASTDSSQLIANLLTANGAPRERAVPAAAAIMKYARLRSLDPLLIVGIIGVENATLVSRARSRVGASGVMQVMPFWKKHIRDCGDDLRQVAVNVCFGTRILQIALDESRTVKEALLRYNGCVRAPNCSRYASAVFSSAGRAILMSRVAAEPRPALAAVEPRTGSQAASTLAGGGM
jgi:soluble lytic murein transglycosylase-like protein